MTRIVQGLTYSSTPPNRTICHNFPTVGSVLPFPAFRGGGARAGAFPFSLGLRRLRGHNDMVGVGTGLE